MRRALVVAGPVLVIAAAVVAILAASASPSETQLQANRLAARRDAQRLVALLRLPTGVRSVSRRPAFVPKPAVAPSGKYNAGATRWWVTTLAPAKVLAYVKAHKPTGATIVGSGSSPDSVELIMAWPALGRQAWDRGLTVSVIDSKGSRSAVLAQSQSYWIWPRQRRDMVPSGVHAVAIRLRIGGGPQGRAHMHTRTYLAWRPAPVGKLVKQLNGLLNVQPGVSYSCPMMLSGGPSLTLNFLSSRSGRSLARARVSVIPGSSGASGWNSCDSISFSVGHRQGPGLTSRTFVKAIGRLFGQSIS
jgi:hypothetical protein